MIKKLPKIFLIAGLLFFATILFCYFFQRYDLSYPEDGIFHKNVSREWLYLTSHLVDTTNPQNNFSVTVANFKGDFTLLVVTDISRQKVFSRVLNRSIPVEGGVEYKAEGVELVLKTKLIKDSMVVSDDPKSIRGIYIIQPRIGIKGKLILDGSDYNVEGIGWIERQFFPRLYSPFNLLRAQVSGWKWWAIQLDNGVEILMDEIYFKRGGKVIGQHPMLIFEENSREHDFKKISRNKYSLKEIDSWKDPITDRTYPISWILEIPEENTKLQIEMAIKDQFIRQATVYEGTGFVSGIYQGKEIKGWVQFDNIIVK